MTSDKYSRDKPNINQNNPNELQLEPELEFPICIICYDNLELHEIAQPPCKCNVEMCTSCLKRQFKIADKDGVLECQCPNPYCKKVFDQSCFVTDKSKISKWLLTCNNNSHPYFHMLNKYKEFDTHELVNIIYYSRNIAFQILKRTSAKWENERKSISNIPKLKLSQVPNLYLKRTHSQDNINIHSIRIRSKSVPHHSSTVRHKLQLQTIMDNDLPIIIDNIDINMDDRQSYSCRTVGTLHSAPKIHFGAFPSTYVTPEKRNNHTLFSNTDTNTNTHKSSSHNSMRKRFLRKLFKNSEIQNRNQQQSIRRGRGRVRHTNNNKHTNIDSNSRARHNSYSSRMMKKPNMGRIGSLPPTIKSKSNPSSKRSSMSRKIIRRLSLLRSSLTDDEKPSVTLSTTNSSFMYGGSLPLPVLTRQRSKSQEEIYHKNKNTTKNKNNDNSSSSNNRTKKTGWRNRMRLRRLSNKNSRIPSTDLTTSGQQMIINNSKIHHPIPQRKLIIRAFTNPPSASASASPFLPNNIRTRKAKIHWGIQHNTYEGNNKNLRLPFYNMSPETDTSGGEISSDAALSQNNDMPPPLKITSAYSSAPTGIISGAVYHSSILQNNTTSSSNAGQLAIPMNNFTNSNSDEQYFTEDEYKHISLMDYMANTSSSNKIEIRKLKPPTPILTPLSMTATPLSELSSDGYPYTHDEVLPNSPSMGSPSTADLSEIPNTTLSPIISGQIYLEGNGELIVDEQEKNRNFLQIIGANVSPAIGSKSSNSTLSMMIQHEMLSREENSDIYEHTPEQTAPYSPPLRSTSRYLKTSDATDSDLYSLHSRKTSNITCTPKQSTDLENEMDEKQIPIPIQIQENNNKLDVLMLTKVPVYSNSSPDENVINLPQGLLTKEAVATQSQTTIEGETTEETTTEETTTEETTEETTETESILKNAHSKGIGNESPDHISVCLISNSSLSAIDTNHSQTDSQPIPSAFYNPIIHDNNSGVLLHNIEEENVKINMNSNADGDENNLGVKIPTEDDESNSVPPTPSSEEFNSLSSGTKRMLPSVAMYGLNGELRMHSNSPMSNISQYEYQRPSNPYMDDTGNNIVFNSAHDNQHSSSDDEELKTQCGCCIL